mgnify:CR=1 FL=1
MHSGKRITTKDLFESDYFDGLVLYLVDITTYEKAEEFIKSILTPKEAYFIGQRTTILALLEEGHTYREIAKLLKVSLSTIARASRQLLDERYQI